MTDIFSAVRVGQPIQFDAITVFPLFAERASPVDYTLSHEALEKGTVVVEEVTEGGSVPDLLVENRGDQRVLFLEGEALIGAKQNRILNTSVLVAGHSRTKIPVSCVEQGRWRYQTRTFASAGTHSPSKLRYALKSSVGRSLMAKRGHRSDQGEVWAEVSRQQVALNAASPTSDMSDTFEAYRERVTRSRDKLPYVAGASGVAVAVGSKIVSCDLFDKPSTCQKIWDRVLSGAVLDAAELAGSEEAPHSEGVQKLLDNIDHQTWDPVDCVGEGQEMRCTSPAGDHASALSFDGSLVHGSVVTAQ